MRIRARTGVWVRLIAACEDASQDVTAGWLIAEHGATYWQAYQCLSYGAKTGRLTPIARGVYRAGVITHGPDRC